MTSIDLSSRFFLQLGVIAGAGAVCSRLGRRILQPPVVCEMVAGVLLGPSLLGWLAPGFSAWLFPREMMPMLYVASQVGLSLYMFCVGLEFRQELLVKGWRSSLAVSVSGIAAPLALGALVCGLMHGSPAFFPPEVRRWQAMLFGGAAVCITAFPMLARIIVERGLAGTRIGTIALGAGACDDLAAWTLLAILIAVFASDPQVAVLAVGGGALYVLAAWFVVKPAARRLVDWAGPAALGSEGMIAVLVALMAASWLTEAIRLYAVFGSFVLGMVMPRGQFSQRLYARIEPLTTALLLPSFFAYTGLSTRMGLLDSPSLWLVTAGVLLASTLAKGGACALAARLTGSGWGEAAAVGTLMNARGLMELILLNIAFERHLITQTTFTIYVLMAVATTLAASPVFELVRSYVEELRQAQAAGREVPSEG